jgi:ParB-like chromosome segregation protein Spo0J
MEQRVSLQDLIRRVGLSPDLTRQPCLPPPLEPAITASAEDHEQARLILLDQRAKNPERKDVLKRIFQSSKDKEKARETTQFSQEELDQALSSVLYDPATSPGLTQAFLHLGAKVNFVEIPKKKSRQTQANGSLRRRSTVLQQAATLRKPTFVSLLASSGADQTTLDEGLKAALSANDHASIQELLRHGADISKCACTH